MENYKIYIVLTRTNSVMSNMIKCIKKDKYTHAAISFDKDLNHMYGFSRKYTYNPLIGVFKKEDINKGLYKLQKDLPGVIIEVEITEKQYTILQTILDEFILEKDKYKYNTKGLFYALLNKEIKVNDKFLCSEFVYYLLKEINLIDWDMSSNLVRPVHLVNVPGKVVFEGNLKDLRQENMFIPDIAI